MFIIISLKKTQKGSYLICFYFSSIFQFQFFIFQEVKPQINITYQKSGNCQKENKHQVMEWKYVVSGVIHTAQKMKFSIKNFFSKCDQIRSFLRIQSHLLNKSLIENFSFCAVQYNNFSLELPHFNSIFQFICLK